MRSVLFETHCDSNMINSKKSTTRERQIHFPVHSPIHWTVIGKWTIDLTVWIGHYYLFPNTYISTRFKPQYKHLNWSKQYFRYNTVFIKHNPSTQRSRFTLDNQLNIKLHTTRFCCLGQIKKYDNDFALRDNNRPSRLSTRSALVWAVTSPAVHDSTTEFGAFYWSFKWCVVPSPLLANAQDQLASALAHSWLRN